MNAFALADKIQKVWPHLKMATHRQPGHIWLRDIQYYVPKLSEADSLIHWHSPWQFWTTPAYRAEKHDCDDFSERMAYEVKQAFSGQWPLAFGICDVTKCQHSKGTHSLNILICEEAILLYDWQQDITWNAYPELDNPFFIRI